MERSGDSEVYRVYDIIAWQVLSEDDRPGELLFKRAFLFVERDTTSRDAERGEGEGVECL